MIKHWVFGNDSELQNQIIDQFIRENLRRYRDKMDKYRNAVNLLYQDVQVY